MCDTELSTITSLEGKVLKKKIMNLHNHDETANTAVDQLLQTHNSDDEDDDHAGDAEPLTEE